MGGMRCDTIVNATAWQFAQEDICSAFGRSAGIVCWHWIVERWPNGALKRSYCKMVWIFHLSFSIFLLIQFLHSADWLVGCHFKVLHALCTLHREPHTIIQGFWNLTSGPTALLLGTSICDGFGFSPLPFSWVTPHPSPCTLSLIQSCH